MSLEVNTSLTAHALHQRERECCDKNNIRIGSKNACLEHAKKLGFLVGACVKIASPKHCMKELSNVLETTQKVLDTKKSCTCEKGLRSRVLVACAIESEAKEIDEWLSEKVQEKTHMIVKTSMIRCVFFMSPSACLTQLSHASNIRSTFKKVINHFS